MFVKLCCLLAFWFVCWKFGQPKCLQTNQSAGKQTKMLANKPKCWQTNQNSDKQTKILANKPNLFVRTLVCLPRLLYYTENCFFELRRHKATADSRLERKLGQIPCLKFKIQWNHHLAHGGRNPFRACFSRNLIMLKVVFPYVIIL